MADLTGRYRGLRPWGPNNPPPKSPGHPPKRPVSEAMDSWLRTKLSSEQLAKLKADGHTLPVGATNADIVAQSIGRKAQRGDVLAAKELADRTEGKSVQQIALSRTDNRPSCFVVEYAPLLPQGAPSEELEAQTKIIDLLQSGVDDEEKEHE